MLTSCSVDIVNPLSNTRLGAYNGDLITNAEAIVLQGNEDTLSSSSSYGNQILGEKVDRFSDLHVHVWTLQAA